MIPVLLSGETKIGWLKDCISCEVTEERNGTYELSLTYPKNGQIASEIEIDRYIKAKPNQTSENQLFRIYSISKPINGIFTVKAEHVSYALSHYPVTSVSLSGNATQAIDAVLVNAENNIGFSHGFSVATSDITLSSDFSVTNASARACLGGIDGSVLDVCGGEYEFDNYVIKLHKERGADNGVVICYGKNLTDVKCDISSESSYTGIYAYCSNDDVSLNLLKTVTNTSGIEAKILIMDFSDQFGADEEMTETALSNKVEDYLAKNDINALTVSMSVSFADLSQSPEYADYKLLETVNLCDTVKIRYTDIGVDISAKVIKTNYDVLGEKYKKITLGSAKSNFATVIKQLQKNTENVKIDIAKTESQITKQYQAAIQNATNAITGNSGGYIRLNPAENPQELLIMDAADIEDATNIWRFNLAGFGHSSTGYDGTYTTAITQDGHIVADFIDTGTLNANIIKAGLLSSVNNEFSFNLESGHIDAADISITGGDINLDGGTLSIVNEDGYKVDMSAGTLVLYQGAGTGQGTGSEYLRLWNTLMYTSSVTADWYPVIAIPTSIGNYDVKGLRIGESYSFATSDSSTASTLGIPLNWTTDYALIEKEALRVRKQIKTNE
ncbi:MAG: phage tail spike protein, partial [Oscillospiraceae bacterium]